MIRLTRLADYAVLLMGHMAHERAYHPDRVHNAADLARETRIPAPTVSKLLGLLARGNLLSSQRGQAGGYALTRAPEDISMADIIRVVEGPIALTDCVEGSGGDCDIESLCGVRGVWHKVNDVISNALDQVSLAEVLSEQESAAARLASRFDAEGQSSKVEG